jgi:hypothetical protein
MKRLVTIIIFVLLGFAVVGLLHRDLFIVLTRFALVKHEAFLSLVISACTGFIVSLVYD